MTDKGKRLEIQAPLVVPNDVAEKWVAEQREAAQKEFEKWSKEFETAKQSKKKKDEIPKRPEVIFVEFPVMETWKLDDSTAAVGIEIATNFIILNRHEEAFNVINFVGENCDKVYKILCDQLEDAKAQLRQAKRTATAMPFVVGLEAYVERLKYVIKMFEQTPMGRKTLQQAEEQAEKFLEKNKYGLYRGEVLLDIGTAHLVSFFDVDNGEKWLNRAAE
jgi:hypothetical protein